MSTIQTIINLITSTHNQIDRMRSPESINRVLLQTVNEIKYICLREKMSESPKLTRAAWRVFSLLEETNDAEVGRSLAFILSNFHADTAFTGTVLDGAVQELLQSGLIEEVNGLARYRVKGLPTAEVES